MGKDGPADELRARVCAAYERGQPLAVRGARTKSFLGRPGEGEALEVAANAGILSYEPTELVITARAGTPLATIEQALAERGQMLGFEPPHYGEGATLGGTLACGLGGPRRAYAGAARDFVLGVRIVNGKGEDLRFGGQVMKNVAGYDLSRLMVGARGTLGIILEASLKVLPVPEREITTVRPVKRADAVRHLQALGGTPWPVSASCYDGENLYVRLSGAPAALDAALGELGGERLQDGGAFWASVREHRHAFFAGDQPLWRLALPPACEGLEISGDRFLEWGGQLCWLRTGAPPDQVQEAARAVGGHATLYRGGGGSGSVYQPLAPEMKKIHQALKAAFDPANILNRHALYPDW